MFPILIFYKKQEDREFFEANLGKAVKFKEIKTDTKSDRISVTYEIEAHAPAGRKFKYTDEMASQIAADRKAGMTLGDLAKKYECSVSTIQNYIKKSKKAGESHG